MHFNPYMYELKGLMHAAVSVPVLKEVKLLSLPLCHVTIIASRKNQDWAFGGCTA